MHSPKTQRAHNMRPNRKTLLPQYCQDQGKGGREPADSALLRVPAPRACRARLYATPAAAPMQGSQAVRSLGPLGCACYQACTCGLATSCSRWDLDCWRKASSGKTRLGGSFALRCFQRLSLLDVAIQRWPRQANWHTSGPAISVLSYWR